MKNIIVILSCLMMSSLASANAYKCAKMVVKDGWLKDYEYIGNTWGANTKKHGAISSTFGSSIEKTTSSVDGGVMTGNVMSSLQYSSSWGECSMLEYHITQEIREEYIDQNLQSIKKQIALGYGHHIESLAFLSGCKGVNYNTWMQSLRGQTEAFYNASESKDFSEHLNATIQASDELAAHCSLI